MLTFVRSLAILACAANLAVAGSPIVGATYAGSLVRVQAAIASGSDVNEQDEYGWTPLMWASYYDYQPIVKFLLEQKGIDLDHQGRKGYLLVPERASALSIASYYGYRETSAMLARAGGNPALADASGNTALTYARKYGFKEILAALEARR